MPRITLKKEAEPKASAPAKEKEVVKEEAPIETKKKEVKKTKKVFEQTDRIKCYSVTQGGLYVEGAKTKQQYAFSDYGDETEIEYRDLVGLVQAKSDYLYHPYFIVDDDDFIVEFPQLEKFYTDAYGVQDLVAVLDLPIDQMLEKLNKLPSGAKENLKVLASSQVADGRLDSVRKIKALNEFFGIDLNMIAELNSNN